MAASDALAWISAIFVALFFAFSSSFVVLAASATSLLRLAISLHRLLSETALVVLLLLATTAVERRRETKILVNCILNDLKLRKDVECLMLEVRRNKAVQPKIEQVYRRR